MSDGEDIDVVLDSSALMAVLHTEPGGQRVVPYLDRAAMSTVNVSEVLKVGLQQRGWAPPVLLRRLLSMGIELFDFSTADAAVAAELWTETKAYGLSLGDRACLALGKRLGTTVLTAERHPGWSKLALRGIRIETIR